MLRPVLLITLVAVAAASGPKSAHGPYPGYKLKPVLSSIGLPSFYNPKYSLGGLTGYLQQKKISQVQFVARIQKYGPHISRIVLPLRKQYKGVLGDLLQLSVLRYYGCEPVVNYKIPLIRYFSRYIRMTKIPSPYRYNAKYVNFFLGGFNGYMRKHVKSPKIVIPVIPHKPSYPGYELLATLKSIGLPALNNPKMSLGGIVTYLKVAKISKATFISRIQIYRSAILKVVLKYQGMYKGYQLDLLQLAALRYYGISKKSKYAVSFSYAFKQTLKLRIYQKYSISYVRIFLARFSRILVTLPYPGYKMMSVLHRIGLPKLYNPKYSLGGLVAYLKVAKISQVTFISRITKYGAAIKKLVLKYKKHYSGYRADLLQLAALRYYGIKKAYSVKFSVAFKKALAPSFKYSVRYVSSFIVHFSKYLVKPVYSGYKLKPLLTSVGLPKLTMPQYSLPGLIAYLHSNKYTRASLISRIQKYAPKIKATVYRYKKQYSGIKADLLQLCAIRYYSLPLVIRRNVRFGYTFQRYLSSQKLRLYSSSYVNQFLNGFIKYIRKYQLKKYSGVLW